MNNGQLRALPDFSSIIGNTAGCVLLWHVYRPLPCRDFIMVNESIVVPLTLCSRERNFSRID